MTKRVTMAMVLALARSAYRDGDADFAVRRGDCALLVIDMQDEFVKPRWTPFWVPEATRQLPAIRRLIRACRRHGVPVVFTAFGATHRYLDRPRTGPLMPNRYRATAGAAAAAWFREVRIWQALAPEKTDIVLVKPSYGAFWDTPLETILKNLGKNTVIICGKLTNFCCGVTARQAYERGFKVVVGSDVCSTDDPAMQEPELMVLRKGFARILTCERIVAELDAGPEESS